MQSKIVFLPVHLTEDELRTKARQQASAMIEFAELEASKREMTAELGGQLKAKRKELDRLAQEVRTGLESRPVDCDLVPIWGDHLVATIRRDTGERIDLRPMSPAERQLELRGVASEPDEGDDADDQDADDEDETGGGVKPH